MKQAARNCSVQPVFLFESDVLIGRAQLVEEGDGVSQLVVTAACQFKAACGKGDTHTLRFVCGNAEHDVGFLFVKICISVRQLVAESNDKAGSESY